jgi:hypothetical protein
MKTQHLIQMQKDVEVKIHEFNIPSFIDKVKKGTITRDRAKKLVNDLYELEEDLLLIGLAD